VTNPARRPLTLLGSYGASPAAGRACSGFLVGYGWLPEAGL